jgi:hypothetical protein
VIARVLADAEPTIVVAENGEQVVVLPLQEYDSWKETLYLLPAGRRRSQEKPAASAELASFHPHLGRRTTVGTSLGREPQADGDAEEVGLAWGGKLNGRCAP